MYSTFYLLYVSFFTSIKIILSVFLCPYLTQAIKCDMRSNRSPSAPTERDANGQIHIKGFCVLDERMHLLYDILYLVILPPRVLLCLKTTISVLCKWIQKLHPGAPHKNCKVK